MSILETLKGAANVLFKDKVTLKGVYNFTVRDAVTGEIKRTYYYENIIPTVGRQNIANNMTAAVPASSLLINKAALGSGTNTPANTDTILQTETYRNDVASRTNSANIGYVTAFYNATEVSGTFREIGLFAGGTATANTGVLMSRVAINITKSTSETLTVDWTLTIS